MLETTTLKGFTTKIAFNHLFLLENFIFTFGILRSMGESIVIKYGCSVTQRANNS